jgi:hypothetical protein
MALGTFSNIQRSAVGNRWLVTGTYTPSASNQSATGDAITAAALKQMRLSKIDTLIFQQIHGNSAANLAGIAWERNTTAGGKIHIYNAVAPHTHDVLALGGLTSSEPLFVDAAVSFGKNAATNRTIVGATAATTGGVMPSAALANSTEAAAGNFSAYRAEFICVGR